MGALTLLTTFHIFLLLSRFICTLVPEKPTFSHVLNKAQPKDSSGLPPKHYEEFWQELDDLDDGGAEMRWCGQLIRTISHQQSNQDQPNTHTPYSEPNLLNAPSDYKGKGIAPFQFNAQKSSNPLHGSSPEVGNKLNKGSSAQRSQTLPSRQQEHPQRSESVAALDEEVYMDQSSNKRRKKESSKIDELARKQIQSDYQALFQSYGIDKTDRRIVLLRLYELVGDKNVDTLRDELDTFLKSVKPANIGKRKRGYSIREEELCKRLSFIMKSSLLQSRLYAQLCQNANAKELCELQKEAFKFLKDFWTLALAQTEIHEFEEDTEGEITSLETLLNKAASLIYGGGPNEAGGEAASWLGTQGFTLAKDRSNRWLKFPSGNVFRFPFFGLILGDGKLCFALSRSALNFCIEKLGEIALMEYKINLSDLLQVVKQREKDWRRRFPERSCTSIVRRIEYAMKASFLKIQFFFALKTGVEWKRGSIYGFEAQCFRLLECFWHFALFGEFIHQNELPEIETKILQEDFLEEARERLRVKGVSKEKAEVASWYATSFCVWWFWGEIVKKEEKTQIYDAILLRARENNIRPPEELDEEQIDNIQESSSSQYILGDSIQAVSRVLGQAELNRLSLDLTAFLKLVRNQCEMGLDRFEGKTDDFIVNRVAYVMRSSFLKIGAYPYLKSKEKYQGYITNHFAAKAFHLLEYFWNYALFGVADKESEYSGIENQFDHENILENARKKFELGSGAEDKGEPPAWHSTAFCVWFFWKEKLTPHQKLQINNQIKLWGKSSDQVNVYEERVGLEDGSNFDQVKSSRASFVIARVLDNKTMVLFLQSSEMISD
ncbi:hypothetical protein O181_046962 [Austropuccinia psidii MF-1]|uniref:Uncharacterized protein n=1 Tax=Austropuccinia psidii MF-1 TaxID=1389203 RepID=A0A9Q3DSA7_9BASI|nr:hypothetical protein [Austropuccinia psidii MF-1]